MWMTFNPHDDPVSWAPLVSPFTDVETDAQACESLPETIQLVSRKTGI